MAFTRRELLTAFFRTSEEKTADLRVKKLRDTLSRGGRLNHRDQQDLAYNQIIATKATRRVFIGRTVAGTAAVGLVYAGVTGYERLNSSETIANDRMLHEIDDLPHSPIEDHLQTHIAPSFQARETFTMNHDGYEYTAHPVPVVETTKRRNMYPGGTYVIVGTESKDHVRIPEPHSFRFPLVRGYVTDAEKASIPSQYFLPDGTIVVDRTIQAGEGFPAGFRARVEILRPHLDSIPVGLENYISALTSYIYIKEGCSLLVYELLAQQTFREMRRLGIPTRTIAIDAMGTKKDVEMVHPYLNALYAEHGRLATFTDAGGIFLALKALEQSPLFTQVNLNRELFATAETLRGIELGTLPEDLLGKTMRWVIQNPDVYKENINKEFVLKNVP